MKRRLATACFCCIYAEKRESQYKEVVLMTAIEFVSIVGTLIGCVALGYMLGSDHKKNNRR